MVHVLCIESGILLGIASYEQQLPLEYLYAQKYEGLPPLSSAL